jgi:hypothetical protein
MASLPGSGSGEDVARPERARPARAQTGAAHPETGAQPARA